jgi:hypothetical protein
MAETVLVVVMLTTHTAPLVGAWPIGLVAAYVWTRLRAGGKITVRMGRVVLTIAYHR